MADVGYVQLRRGILEHLQVGRLTSDEFAAFTVILLKADYRTGVWPGTSKTLARLLGWCERKGRSVLGELGAKGYLCITRVRRHRSEVTINRYFGQNSAAPGCRHSADGGTGMPSLSRIAAPGCREEQEVILRKPPQEGAPQDPRHAGGKIPISNQTGASRLFLSWVTPAARACSPRRKEQAMSAVDLDPSLERWRCSEVSRLLRTLRPWISRPR